MKIRRNWSWRLLLPIALALIGVWALAGCFYLPIPEHRVDGTQKDFMRLAGPDVWSPAIHEGLTRAQVVALLGKGRSISADKSRVVYFLDTEDGFWVWPLCFAAYSDHRHAHMLVIAFDAQDRIKDVVVREEMGNGGDWLNNSVMDFKGKHEQLLSQVSHLWPATSEPAKQ